MPDRLTLTGAELALLLSTEPTPVAAPLLAVLGITPEDTGDAAARAALGALLLRGLATPDPDRIRFDPAVAAVAEGLMAPRYWIEIGLVADDTADGAVLVEGPGERFLLSPRPFHTFDIVGVDPAASVTGPTGPICTVVQRFLTTYQPAVASVRVTVPGRSTGDDDTSGFVTAVTAAPGEWAVRTSDAQHPDLTEEAGLSHLAEALAARLPITR
jgi:hypothetical protein